MIRWIPYTFVRITTFFVAGISIGVFFPELLNLRILEDSIFAGLLFYIVLFFLDRYRRKAVFNPGVLGLTIIFLAGWVHAIHSDESRNPEHVLNLEKRIRYFTVTLTRFSEEKERSFKVEGRVNEVFTDHWQNVQGRIIMYFSKDDFGHAPGYGEKFLCQGSPRVIDPPGNPGEFDYKRYLGLKNIFHQHFARASNSRRTGFEAGNAVMRYAIATRVWANETLKKFIPGEREQGVASALVLGVTDGLDNELLQAYAGTGAMHVLAVSGLHITIIYLIIAWFLQPISKLKSGAWIIAITSLIILWAYAFVTGLSPSVLRAVTMFSFLAVAKPTNQSTNIYNTLAASAFCILMFDPFLILSVGFQLSYLAVIGIVYLHPKFYPLWEPTNRLLDEIWKITSVSIAAQVATLPLGLLYFHQFPNYFLISNLLVIPGSFVVLIGGLLILVTSFFPLIAGFVAMLTAWMIKIINFIVFTVEQFPYSLIEDIHITNLQCWILIGMILSILLLAAIRRFSFVLMFFALSAFFAVAQWKHFKTEFSTPKLFVYRVAGHSAIDLIHNGRAQFIADTSLRNDQGKISFHIKPNRLKLGVSDVETDVASRIIEGGKLIHWNGITALIISKQISLPDNFYTDFLIVSNNAIFDIQKIPDALKKSNIILDSSNSVYFAESFLKKASSMNLNVHSVLHRGSFEYRIENTSPP